MQKEEHTSVYQVIAHMSAGMCHLYVNECEYELLRCKRQNLSPRTNHILS